LSDYRRTDKPNGRTEGESPIDKRRKTKDESLIKESPRKPSNHIDFMDPCNQKSID